MTKQPIYLIDPPSPFASLSDWLQFHEDMQKLGDPFHPQIMEHLSIAKQMIDEKADQGSLK